MSLDTALVFAHSGLSSVLAAETPWTMEETIIRERYMLNNEATLLEIKDGNAKWQNVVCVCYLLILVTFSVDTWVPLVQTEIEEIRHNNSSSHSCLVILLHKGRSQIKVGKMPCS